MNPNLATLVAAVLLAGCSSTHTARDPSDPDTGPPDPTGGLDTGGLDTGRLDTGRLDTGRLDTGTEAEIVGWADVLTVLAPHCGSCHMLDGGGGEPVGWGQLGFFEPDDLLIPSKQALDLAIVAPGSAEDSYLWHKVSGTHLDVGGSGWLMPPEVMLPQAELDRIYAWIEGGARE